MRRLFLVGVIALASIALAPQSPTVTITTGTTYQTMRGWEAQVFAKMTDPDFGTFSDLLFDTAIASGIDRLRLEVRSGSENTSDSYAAFAAAGYPTSGTDYDTWRAKRYEAVNDNANPNSADGSKFFFTELDDTIDAIVTPMRTKATAAGRPLYINLNYVAFTNQVTSGIFDHDDPDEYAEFILQVFQHIDDTYGWSPDGLEIILEPDNVTELASGTMIGNMIVAVCARLSAAGFTPEIIAPSNTNMANAITYFDDLIAVTGALALLDEFSYHRYGGVSDANLNAIGSRTNTNGITSSMLEHWDASYTADVVYKDLTMAFASSIQQRTLIGMFTVDETTPTVTATEQTRLFRHWYRKVRRGAVRVAASSSNGSVSPTAFVNTDGSVTVVIYTPSAQSFTIGGLPDGTYHIIYSTASVEDSTAADQVVTGGSHISTSMPAMGTMTIYNEASAAMRLGLRISGGGGSRP